MKKISGSDYLFAFLSFSVPLILFYTTSSSALMFDDSAEFALVIKLGSIAHPPGTPAYIALGMLWEKITAVMGVPTITSLTLFSSLCISAASLLLFFTFRKIVIESLSSGKNEFHAGFISFLTSVGFATGATSWAWANTVEVYAFQVLAMAIAFCGLTHFHFNRSKSALIVSAIGLAMGLANHHLTMILFLPFTPLFFLDSLFKNSPEVQTKEKNKRKQKSTNPGILISYFSVLKSRNFLLVTGLTATVTLLFYGWMFIRAQQEHPFMFGKPDTFSGMIYHMSGGSYTKNIANTSKKIIAARVPFFLKLTAMQLFLFLPFFLLGVTTLWKKKNFRLLSMILLFFLTLFLYQLNNNQWASTDAYMLLPFLVLSIAVLYGICEFYDRFKLIFILPFLLLAQIAYNFPAHNRKSYPVSADLMHLLDTSSPKNSIVLISDWSTVIQYYYYRISENFRPDLVVLNYDLKFTHYRILPVLYPDFYKKIQKEYDEFIDALKAEHPEQIANTGCDLSTPRLLNSFLNVLNKMQVIAKEENRAFLTDPKTHYFYSNQKLYDPKRFVSGCFSSSVPGDSLSAAEFLRMDFPFIQSPLLFTDAGAIDKMVDFQAMLDQHLFFYQANHDTLRSVQAEKAKETVLRLQREIKRSMSFAFSVK
ncbi:MAG: DUF2723 domain-containing protein [Bacteroidetes bacterium]|nr:DUF2723 domain-containing protein [Bacteroidota bacterium]MBK9525392.1 DUF2723 domain-containing protein [Bacteroidota bacterium]MBK9542337.1 DUF2723 domain-containing protein [Bacteroidota bacterium]MBP6402681.1 DUF2723 domain-containing protein [Bacteroidia bacterium]MBP6648267.1 DUF2723 domain-containing protein [Bacteroidia bacterium]